MTASTFSPCNTDQFSGFGFPLLFVGPQSGDPSNATTDLNDFKKRWQRAQAAGVAVATGSTGSLIGLVVEGPAARAELAELESTHGQLPPTTTTLCQHRRVYLLKVPVGFKVPTLSHLPGSTLGVQGEGGMVLLPPSVNEYGESLAWGMMPNHGPAPVPDWLLEWIRAAAAEAERTAMTDPAKTAAVADATGVATKLPGVGRPTARSRVAGSDPEPITESTLKQSRRPGQARPLAASRPPSGTSTAGKAPAARNTQATAARSDATKVGPACRGPATARAGVAGRHVPTPAVRSRPRKVKATDGVQERSDGRRGNTRARPDRGVVPEGAFLFL